MSETQETIVIFQYPITEEIGLAIREDGIIMLTNSSKPHPRAMIIGELMQEISGFNEGCNWVINGRKATDKIN